MMISWCFCFFFWLNHVNFSYLLPLRHLWFRGFAEVEDFSGRQTFQVWQTSDKTVRGPVGSLPHWSGHWRCWSLEHCISRRQEFLNLGIKKNICWKLAKWRFRRCKASVSSRFFVRDFLVQCRRPIAHTLWSWQRVVARWGYCEHLSRDCENFCFFTFASAWNCHTFYWSVCSLWHLWWRPFELPSKTMETRF